jgi:hypothetical protein
MLIDQRDARPLSPGEWRGIPAEIAIAANGDEA